MLTLAELRDTLPGTGTVEWIGLRPGRREPVRAVQQVHAGTESGLDGDRYAGRSGKRQVTLIQAEHLPVIASCLGQDNIAPELLRRNIVIRGINLLALKDRCIRIGDAELEITGACHPCSHMEETLGPGGYNAVRGHGGLTARVVQSGNIGVGDSVAVLAQPT